MNNKIYFEDLYIFARFIFLNKFIFIFSIFLFSIFSSYHYYTSYLKYLDGVYDENLIEISTLSNIYNLSNKELIKVYKRNPLKILTRDQYDINHFLNLFYDVALTAYFDQNELSYETVSKNNKKIIYRFNNSEYFKKIITEKNILNHYEITKNEFILNIQEGINYTYQEQLNSIYSYFEKLKYNSRIRQNWDKAKEIDRRYGLKYIYSEICQLDERLWFASNINLSFDCNLNKEFKYNSFVNDKCIIQNTNIGLNAILDQYMTNDTECYGGVYPDRNVFVVTNNYIDKIKNSNFIDLKFSTEKKYKFPKPKFLSYLIATILFGFFFSIILVFLFRVKKYF